MPVKLPGDLDKSPVFQPERTQSSAPDTTRIQSQQALLQKQTQGGPVPECDCYFACFPVFVFEPGPVSSGLASRWSAGAGQNFTVCITKAKPGQDIADQQPALPAGPGILPLA